jgi:23S rRNA (uracil1939-C5)-methyltransferase
VESLNFDGRGVGRIDGKTIFLEGALPGESVQFRYHDKRKTYDTGRALTVLRASADRVTPRCDYFGVCGGCSLQHMDAAAQGRAKRHIVADALSHIGRIQPNRWLDVVSGPTWHYRRRARLSARLVPKKGGLLIGFRERRSSYITNLDTCLTLRAEVSQLLPAMRELIQGLSCPSRVPQIEIAVGDNAVALVIRHLEPLTDTDRGALRRFSATHGVYIYLQPNGVDSVEPLVPVDGQALVYGLPEFDLKLEFHPTDFIQINDVVNRQMVCQAVTLLELQPQDQVLDLFCGLGNFSLALARRAGRVLGLDADGNLIERARHNALNNNVGNATFEQADLYLAPNARGPWNGFHFNKLLLDPPRAGAIEIIKCLTEHNPARILYVSCHPATLARDGDYLVHTRGYRLEAAGVLDMFPHTQHVETMALFVRP